MQLNKCSRCGCFFMSDSDVCPNCKPKDIYDMNKLKSFLENYDPNSSIEEISYSTGISEKNLHRLICSDEFVNYNFTSFGDNPKINL